MIRTALIAAILAVSGPATAETLTFEPYMEQIPGLNTLDLDIGGQSAHVLFDTGGGFSSVTPDFAARIGCTPYGSASGFRMRGDRVDLQKCGARQLQVAGRTVEREIGAFDLAILLPPEAPRLDGIVGLDILAGRTFTLSLADRRLYVDERRGDGWHEGVMRTQREMGGAGVSVFVRVNAPMGTLWMLLDSGSVGSRPIMLSRGALEQLGLSAAPNRISLDVTGAGPHEGAAQLVEHLLYDGVIGEAFMRDFDIAIDLEHERIWWRPRQPAP